MRQVVKNLDLRVKVIGQKVRIIENMLVNSSTEIEETARHEKSTWL